MFIVTDDPRGGYLVAFKFNRQIVDAIKEIPGSYWLEDRKVWHVHQRKREDLLRLVARFSPKGPKGSHTDLMQLDVMELSGPQFVVDKTLPDLTVEIPLKIPMRHYQGQGVAYNLEKLSSIIGDQQGTGKTIQAIATVIALNAFPCLVIAKGGLLLNWEKEWKKCSSKVPIVMRTSIKNSWPMYFRTGAASVGVVSFDSLKKFFVDGVNHPADGSKPRIKDYRFRETISMFKSVIIDESHLIKDGMIERTKLVLGICSGKEHVFCLTGTPILNNPVEIYTQLCAIGRNHLFGNYAKFKARYSKNNPRIKEYLPYLNFLLHKHCYYRRLKSEVATEIPPKTRQVVLCDITNRSEYDRAEEDFVDFLNQKVGKGGIITKQVRAQALVQMQTLKLLSARGKLEHMREWMEEILENGEKAVIFGHHIEITKIIKNFFPHQTVTILGSDPLDVRFQNEKRFQEDDRIRFLVSSIGAGAEGYNLTAATNVGIYELPWHFGKAEQCEDRCHRIGTSLPVTISYFLGENTIDRRIYQIIMSKKDMHDLLTGTDEVVHEETIDLLIGSLFNKANQPVEADPEINE